MYEHWSDRLTIAWDFTLGPLSLIANFMLIYLILKHTPPYTKTYTSIILAISISDCLSFTGTFMTSARIMPRGPQLFVIFRGLCIYCFKDDVELKSQVCLFWFAFRVQFYILNHIILIFSYVYRMLIVIFPFRKISNRTVVYTILKVYSALHFCYFTWVWYMALKPMEIVNREISKYQPDIVGSNATYYGITNLTDPSQIVFNILSVTSSMLVILVAVLCRWNIARFSKKFEHSESVKKLHESLDAIFTCQTIGPLISTVTTILYVTVLTQLGASAETSKLLENLIGRPYVLMYIVNPIVTIYFMTPYKVEAMKWFGVIPLKFSRRRFTIDNSSQVVNF